MQAAAQQEQAKIAFYNQNPHLRGKEALVGAVVSEMNASGELQVLDQAAAMAEVARRAASQLAPAQTTEPPPQPPPVTSATPSPQQPSAPEPGPVNLEESRKQAIADQAKVDKEQRARQRSGGAAYKQALPGGPLPKI